MLSLRPAIITFAKPSFSLMQLKLFLLHIDLTSMADILTQLQTCLDQVGLPGPTKVATWSTANAPPACNSILRLSLL